MTETKILNGKTIAALKKQELKKIIEAHPEKSSPSLLIIQVGDNPASNIYIKNKIKACQEIGVKAHLEKKDINISENELILSLKALSKDYDGVFVQLPLPFHINSEKVIKAINPSQDVDGFCEENIGSLVQIKENESMLLPCTAKGVVEMLQEAKVDLKGKHCVIVNRNAIVGKPLAMMLLNRDATVTICHSQTKNLKEICQDADILVTAIGKSKFFNKDYIKDGAVVIDVGINRDENNKVCGDVDFDDVIEKVSFITPVPGGVGQMTVIELLSNLIYIWEKKS